MQSQQLRSHAHCALRSGYVTHMSHNHQRGSSALSTPCSQMMKQRLERKLETPETPGGPALNPGLPAPDPTHPVLLPMPLNALSSGSRPVTPSSSSDSGPSLGRAASQGVSGEAGQNTERGGCAASSHAKAGPFSMWLRAWRAAWSRAGAVTAGGAPAYPRTSCVR